MATAKTDPVKTFTKKWWHKLLKDEEKLIQWLNRLFHNEKEADARFVNFATKFCVNDPETRHTFMTIANQEARHAHMVLQVMISRGYMPWVEVSSNERYWDATRNLAEDLRTAAAVGAYAEVTSLNRLRVLAEDPKTPEDLRKLFQEILPEEQYHAKVLADIAGPEAMAKVRPFHEAGLKNLGVRK